MPAAARADIHRVGGGRVENLRLKPREALLDPPGISVLKAVSADAVARQMRQAFPDAEALHVAVRVIGSTTADRIRNAGFDLIPNPTKRLPNHFRLVHPDGVTGFNGENLRRLSGAFIDSEGH